MQAPGYALYQTGSPARELRDCGEPTVVGEQKEPYFLALDPGLHTGWATWDESGTPITMGTVHNYDALHELLESFPSTIRVVILEDFILFKHKAREQSGSKMPAPKAIGQIETFARLWRAQIVKQPSSIKAIAERSVGGMSTKGMAKIRTHMWDAYNHGNYYLIKQGIKKITPDELRKSLN